MELELCNYYLSKGTFQGVHTGDRFVEQVPNLVNEQGLEAE